MAVSTYPLSRLPLQNVERCTSTFESWAAARVGAETIPDLHQNAVLIDEKQEVLLAEEYRPKEVKEPLVPCGVSFPLFFPLVERKEAVGDRTGRRQSRESVSASAKYPFTLRITARRGRRALQWLSLAFFDDPCKKDRKHIVSGLLGYIFAITGSASSRRRDSSGKPPA